MENKFGRYAEAIKKREEVEKTMRMGSFAYAIQKILDGRKMKRLGWNGKEQYIELASNISYQRPNGEVVNPDHKMIENCAIAFWDGGRSGWMAGVSGGYAFG